MPKALQQTVMLVILQRLAEHDQVRAEEVEGANDFLRATKQEHEHLRHRPARPHAAGATSAPGSTAENV